MESRPITHWNFALSCVGQGMSDVSAEDSGQPNAGVGALGTDAFCFGPFKLYVAQRILTREGIPLHLGSRALDILITLVEHAGKVVSKNELMARVWPDVTVDEGALRVQVGVLRKTLGDGRSGARYMTTLTGQGYCFVAPVLSSSAMDLSPSSPQLNENGNLPSRLMRMVGRDDAVHEVLDQLLGQRFVTITGPGGIGKTTVAVSVGHRLLTEFDGAVRYFDLGPVHNSLLVPGVVASALGLAVQPDDPLRGIIAFLRDARMLVVFDSCEHVIDSMAELAEEIFEKAPLVHILATSRESLRVEGEHVYRLPCFDSPPDTEDVSSKQALRFPAVQLFVERAGASERRYVLSDADAPFVCKICRKLDGIALAIELAAGRVNACSVRETMELLDDRFDLLWEGRRTAPARHQTLSATLDWSYDLLTRDERLILRRLSVFAGFFSLEAGRAVVVGDGVEDAKVIKVIANLVAKSLVAGTESNRTKRYRLLDVTRIYAAGKLVESGDEDAVKRRHAIYYTRLLERASGESAPTGIEDAMPSSDHLGNVRAALEWSFLKERDDRIGVVLAAVSAWLFMDMSLLSECLRWSARAIGELDEGLRGTRYEIDLLSALGQCLMFTTGNSEETRLAFERGLRLAEANNDQRSALQLLSRLFIFSARIGDFEGGLEFARRGKIVAEEMADPAMIADAHTLLGIAHHHIGNTREAYTHLEAATSRPPTFGRNRASRAGVEHRNRAYMILAHTRWLQGFPDQAVSAAWKAVEEAAAFGDPVTHCIVLIWGSLLFLYVGDLGNADKCLENVIAHAERHSLRSFHATSLGVRGEVLTRRGNVEAGIEALQRALEVMHALRYEVLTPELSRALAEGLLLAGRYGDALTLMDDTITTVRRAGGEFNLPELLRVKAQALLSFARPDALEVEKLLLQSLEIARRQGALAWELRTATSLARMWLTQDRYGTAQELLAPIFGQFTEGFGTYDLEAARELLDKLRTTEATPVGVDHRSPK
jgi:predicted ATPase/DNA-binding winged helix-turn-helix (wHTH) protein